MSTAAAKKKRPTKSAIQSDSPRVTAVNIAHVSHPVESMTREQIDEVVLRGVNAAMVVFKQRVDALALRVGELLTDAEHLLAATKSARARAQKK